MWHCVVMGWYIDQKRRTSWLLTSTFPFPCFQMLSCLEQRLFRWHQRLTTKFLIRYKTVWGRWKCLFQAFSPFLTFFKSLFVWVFSSTGQRPVSYCHGVVSIVCLSVHLSMRACVCMCASANSAFKKPLLRNYWLDFYEISQECSLGGPLSNSFKKLCSMKNSGFYGNQSKKPCKNLLPKH